MEKIRLKDGTIVTSQDVVFSYKVENTNKIFNIPIGTDIWYEDICDYFDISLETAANMPEEWFDEVKNNKEGFKDWIEADFKVYFPSGKLL